MNVLVVEDAPEVRRRLVAMVNQIPGAAVAGEAETVQEAVTGALSNDVDAMLLDLQLKDGSGLEVLAQVKPERPGVRVIVLTNLVTAQHRRASRAAGADLFLDKSQEFDAVPRILREWIGPSAGASGTQQF